MGVESPSTVKALIRWDTNVGFASFASINK